MKRSVFAARQWRADNLHDLDISGLALARWLTAASQIFGLECPFCGGTANQPMARRKVAN